MRLSSSACETDRPAAKMARNRDRGLPPAAAAGGLVVAVVLFCLQSVPALGQQSSAVNVTRILQPYPDYSLISQWFTQTGVDEEVNNRSSITILVASNAAFSAYLSSVNSNPSVVADTLRYLVLLQLYGPTQLSQLSPNGTLVTTLLQATGRANATQGLVKLYKNGSTYHIGHDVVDSAGNATVLTNVTQSDYTYSVLAVDRVLAPEALTAAAPTPAPIPAPVPSPSLSPAPALAPTPVPVSAPVPVLAPTSTPPAATPSSVPSSEPTPPNGPSPGPGTSGGDETPTGLQSAASRLGGPRDMMGKVAILCAVLLSSAVAAMS